MLAFSISFFLLLVRYQACCSWNSGAFPQGSALAVGDPCSSPHSCPAHLFFFHTPCFWVLLNTQAGSKERSCSAFFFGEANERTNLGNRNEI